MGDTRFKYTVRVRAEMFHNARTWCWNTCGGSNRELPPGLPGNQWMAVPLPLTRDPYPGQENLDYMFYFENEDTAFEAKVRFG